MFRLLAAVLAAAVPATAQAAPQKYLCDFTGHDTPRKVDDGGFISEKYLLEIDAGNSTATAYDALAHSVDGAPVTAKFTRKRDGQYRLRWKLAQVPVIVTKTVDYGIPDIIETTFTMRYSVLFDPEAMQGILSASGAGERFTSSAKLVCQKTNKSLAFR
ncbi:hypothetical protein RA19_05810 [Leisingera sp. ANG-M1]|uniref:hypothetical protein n=1 Tax=Leisingera sp. ANG-M1 TaxID=1577895 RepID=UPI00057FA8EF|nr:hypothetical protein [Leisingera sp. ANG-M1]KIC11553.1 hypothetical protein RA19_05810 [Leisingera sp. ANG-M1]